MITQKDIKILKLHETRMGKISHWMLILAPVFFLAMCLLNLKTASEIGNKIGYNLMNLLQSWIHGIDVNKQYSGIYLLSMERLSTALLQFGTALVMSVFILTNQILRKRNMRILKTLRDCGVIKD